ncbi:RidA family protein [Alkalibaculum sporogenes]|uniref:RidA family protein n=1 Tax=Alkalibaculum sporogenes TaxID=2655001 RepID=UPI0024841666|nr:RidA family protein [Alkalibaculum sporogenes]
MNSQAINTKDAPQAIGPYSQGIKFGQLIYTSGQIPLDPTNGEVVSEKLEIQTVQVLENLKNVLEAGGSGLENVIKTTVFIKNMDDFSTINKIYAEYFPNNLPARSCVEVSRLPMGVLIEIEAVASINEE